MRKGDEMPIDGALNAPTPAKNDIPDVRAIRERLKLSQNEFAAAYGIPLATLKGWEQGRRRPDSTAAAYLKVIARKPRHAREALAED